MSEPKSIELTESVVAALEAVKQALRVLCGYEISFTGDLQIEPQAIRAHTNTTCKLRKVEIIGRYRQNCDDKPIFFSAMVDLSNHGANWLPYYIANLCIKEKEGVFNWYLAEWGVDKDPHTVRVLPKSNDAILRDGLNWRVGRSIHDRRLVPLYPTATK